MESFTQQPQQFHALKENHLHLPPITSARMLSWTYDPTSVPRHTSLITMASPTATTTTTTTTTAPAAPDDLQNANELVALLNSEIPAHLGIPRRCPSPDASVSLSGYRPMTAFPTTGPDLEHIMPSWLQPSIRPPPPSGEEHPVATLRRRRGFVNTSLYAAIAGALEEEHGRVMTLEVVAKMVVLMQRVAMRRRPVINVMMMMGTADWPAEPELENIPLFKDWLGDRVPGCPLVKDLRLERVLVDQQPREGEDGQGEMDLRVCGNVNHGRRLPGIISNN
ncbi:hypothetical protein IWZ01DRAFT_169832 [Phyllosticta capitalensis]